MLFKENIIKENIINYFLLLIIFIRIILYTLNIKKNNIL